MTSALANQIVPFNVAASIEAVKQLSEIVSGLRQDVFRPGHDFGVIPGTGNKPTLLLPGMEKLMRALRLRPEYHAVSITEDFDKGLFAYRYECRLIEYDTGLCVSTAIGSCNSKESKYRWREQKRTCPKCNKETINRSKFPPKENKNAETGWYCYVKAGGCGAEFAHNDKTITDQPVGRVENPDIFDQVNTIDKIAQKRALGSAIKGAANVSEHFTVDLEDLYRFEDVVEGQFTEVKLVDKTTGEITEAPLDFVGGAGSVREADINRLRRQNHIDPSGAKSDQPQPAPETVESPALTLQDIKNVMGDDIKYRIEPNTSGHAQIILEDKSHKRDAIERIAGMGFKVIKNIGTTNWFDIDLKYEQASPGLGATELPKSALPTPAKPGGEG